MPNTLSALEQRLAPAENLFFTWLLRVFLAGILAGTSWIDDAPPLELGALLISGYVAFGLLVQSHAFFAVAPFENRVLKLLFAIVSLALMALAFPTVAIFASTLALAALGE